MKPKAALFNLWEKHYPVIKAFAERNPDYVILLQYGGFRNLPMFASFSGRIIPFEQFVTVADHPALRQGALEKAAFLGDLPSTPAWTEFCGRMDVPAPETAAALFHDAGQRVLEQIVQIECLERAREILDIRIAVLNEENTLLPKSMVVWAKSRGIPVLHINHSLGMIGWYTVHEKIISDALAVYGPIVADGPMETGLTGDRIFISGNPDWLPYSDSASLKPIARREILGRLFAGESAPLAVFGTTFAANLTATEERKDTSASARAFFRAISELRKGGRKIHCVVKLRPNNDKSFEDEYVRIASSEGIAPGECVFARTDLEKLLLAADAIVSVDSTLSADALLADTPAINLVTEEGWRRGPYYPGYTGILECRSADLAGCLADAIWNGELKRKLGVLRKRSRSAFQGSPQGGDPTAYLADLIARMIAGAEPGSREAAGERAPRTAETPWEAAGPGTLGSIDLGNRLESSLDPEGLLRKAADALADGGELACSVRNTAHARVIGALIEGRWEPGGAADRIRYFTLSGVRAALAKAGFESIVCVPEAGAARIDPAWMGLLEALRAPGGPSLEHAGIENYAIKARKSPSKASGSPATGRKGASRRKAESVLTVVRPSGSLPETARFLAALSRSQRLKAGYICLVPPGQIDAARAQFQGKASVLESAGRLPDWAALERAAAGMEGDCVAFLDPGTELAAGWDLRLSRHLTGNSAVGPLVNQIAGTQSVYHYLPAGRVDPDAVEPLSEEVRMRFPGMSLASDWLYDQALVLGRDAFDSLSAIPDRKPDDHFAGLGRKLRLAGARLLVAKDVYARLGD